MVNLWNSIAAHWQSLGINGIVAASASTITWVTTTRKEWKQNREAKREAKTDAQVLGEIRTLCQGNSSIYRTQDVAKGLNMTIDQTADSLERLEFMGRVQRYDIGTFDQPGPGWRSKFR